MSRRQALLTPDTLLIISPRGLTRLLASGLILPVSAQSQKLVLHSVWRAPDRARARLMRWLLGTRFRAVLTERDRRLAFVATLSVVAAALLTLLAPAWLLLAGPLLLGVPHLASDVRYLVLRRALPRGFVLVVVVCCLSVVGLRVADMALNKSLLQGRVELGLASAWIAIAWVVGGRLAPRPALPTSAAGWVGGSLLFAGAVTAQLWPWETQLALAHVHNLIAIGLWVMLFDRARRDLRPPTSAAARTEIELPRGTKWILAPVALALLIAGCLQLYPVQRFALTYGVTELGGLSVVETARWLSPFGATRWTIGMTLAYAALQSVHYTVWLYCIPNTDMRAQGSPTFRMSARSWLADFGAPALALIALAACALLLGGLVRPERARGLYLSLAGFHAYLELALWVYFVRSKACSV